MEKYLRLLPLLFLNLAMSGEKEISMTYSQLKKAGIVSGFGIQSGDPSHMVNRIPAIEKPEYVKPSPGLYEPSDLCAGIKTKEGMKFSPLHVLNSHEIVSEGKEKSLAFCPLAGLAMNIHRDVYISGLLKWDTFVLWDKKTGELLLPFQQQYVGTAKRFDLGSLELMTYAGVLKNFPNAKVLNPKVYRGSRNAYGDYPANLDLGIGHEKPGLTYRYSMEKDGYHPKEFVLVVGTAEKLLKAYPLSELENKVGRAGGHIEDTVGGEKIKIHYMPEYKRAYVSDPSGKISGRAFSYVFALKQHLPDLPLFSAVEK